MGRVGTGLRLGTAILSVLAWPLSSCGTNDVRFPSSSHIVAVVWSGNGDLYAMDRPESTGADRAVWRIHDRSAEKVKMTPVRDVCSKPYPLAIFRLPTDWGAAVTCFDGPAHIVAMTQAGAERLATVTSVDGMAAVAWNSSAAAGVIGQSFYSCGSMLPVAQGKLSTWPQVLGGKLAEEGLNTSLIKDETCAQSGDMEWPAFAADGSLYFAGSPATRGVRGFARDEKDHIIFRADMERGSLEKVATGFSNVNAVSVSDDGSVIAVTGERQNADGLHIVRPRTGQVCYQKYPDLTSAAVAPDGRRVAVVVQLPGESGYRISSISVENLESESCTAI